jgi:HJR/Mrr/RecB family endonuclease
MAAYRENLLELLVDAPWWVSAGIAAAVFVVLKFILPELVTGQSLAAALAGGLADAAWLIALIVLIPAPVSAYNTWKKDRLLSGREDPAAIKKLSRGAFTRLVEDIYAANGYRIKPDADPYDEAEVDLIAENESQQVLVQHRHHKSGQITPKAVQAMLDRLEKGDAQKAHVISCSGFTQEASELAAGSNVQLIDVNGLEKMIKPGQS